MKKMKKMLLGIFFLFFMASVLATTSISSVTASPNPVTQGSTTTVTATVQATGETATNTVVTISVPTGLSVSGSTSQTIDSISSGSSESVSWTVSGDVASASAYTVTVSITGGSSSQLYLTVNNPPLIATSGLSCSTSSMAYNSSITMIFTVKNDGGSATNAQVAMSATSGLTLSSGNSSWSSDMNSGGSVGLTYVYTGSSSNCGSKTITAAITSNYNNPTDLACTVTTTGCSTGNGNTGGGGGSSGGSGGGESGTSVVLETEPVVQQATPEEIASILAEIGSSRPVGEVKALAEKVEFERKGTVFKVMDGNTTAFASMMRLTVRNSSQTMSIKNLKILEKIPKAILANATGHVTVAGGTTYTVLKDDPVLQFEFAEILPGESATVDYNIDKNLSATDIGLFKGPVVLELQEAVPPVQSRCTKASDCDDQNPCTQDTCPRGRCQRVAVQEGIACGAGKVCRGGFCIESGGVPPETGPFQPQPPSNILSNLLIAVVAIVVIGAGAYLYWKEKKGKHRL